MGHLSAEELLDIAEGTRPADSLPHAASCVSCREQLILLRGALTEAAGAGMPEPSPLFWDHLSARVRDAVAMEKAPRRRWLGGWSWRAVPLASAAGVAVLLVSVAISSRGLLRQPPPATPHTVASASVALPSDAPDVEPLVDPAIDSGVDPDANPSFAIVADLTTGMDMDTALQAGLVSNGSADHAVEHLNDGELRELERLLKDEIAHAQTS